jgi:hypothetical protein
MRHVLFLAILLMALPAYAGDFARPPAAGSLLFGSPLKEVEKVLGPHTETDILDPFLWHAFPMGQGQLRIGFYKDRASAFKLIPATPLTWAQARAWALAFALGFERGRQDHTDPHQWHSFSNVVLRGRPFEVQLDFDRNGDKVTGMGGEIHWMD